MNNQPSAEKILSIWNPTGQLFTAEYVASKNNFYPMCPNKFNRDAGCRIEKGAVKPCQDCPGKAYVPLSEELIRRHISGSIRIGVYPLQGDVISWEAADLDGHRESQNPYADVRKLADIAVALDIPLMIFSSNSGNGLHCYLFFNGPVPAYKARALLLEMLERAGVDTTPRAGSYDAIIPKQDALNNGGLGNPIALPWNGKAIRERNATLLLDPSTLEPYEDNFETFLEYHRPLSESDVDALLREMGVDPEKRRQDSRATPSDSDGIKWDGKVRSLPVSDRIKTLILEPPDEGERSEEEMSALNALARAGLSNAQIFDVFHKYPIGDRFRERRESQKWLQDQIDKARAYVGEPQRKFTRQELADRIEAATDFDELTGQIARDVAESGLPDSHILSLRKFIAKRSNEINKGAGVSVSSLVADAQGYNNVNASKDLLHLETAREVIKSYGDGNLIESNGTWKWEKSGVWRKTDKRELKAKIHQVAESEELTKSIVDSVLDMIRTEAFVLNHRFDVDRRTINVLNGELEWNGKCWQLIPHCREHYRTTQLPVAHDPNGKAPRFLQFLQEVFRDDPDRVDKISIVLEAIGYSLLSTCEYEKFILLIGPGANGKSVLMHVIGALVGREHVAAVQPSQFDSKFQRAHLHCKLVNLVTEIAEGHEIADAQLKAIVSGELTTVEHKHKDPFDFHPFATCWFGTNHMPHTRDFSDALFRRAIILTFNRTFAEEEQDEHLKDKLILELPGILNLALGGIQNVFLRGGFTKAESCETAKREWRLNCDQVAQFVEDRCTTGPGLMEYSSRLFTAYREWAQDMGIKKTLNHKNFTSRLVRLGMQQTRGTGGARMIAGLELI